MKRRPVHLRLVLRFLAGGLCSALVDIGGMSALLHVHTPPLQAASAGFAAGLVFNYAFHTLITFDSAFSAGALVRYLMVVLLNYLITLALVSLAMNVAPGGINDAALAGKIIALPLVTINGFLLSRAWIYKRAP